MESFDKKVSDLYNKDGFDEVPAEFSWLEINEGIYEKLDKNESKKRPIAWFWFAGISILVIGMFIYNTNTTISNGKHTSNDTIDKESTTLIKNKESINLNQYNISETTSNSYEEDQKISESFKIVTPKSIKEQPTKYISLKSLGIEKSHEKLNQSNSLLGSNNKSNHLETAPNAPELTIHNANSIPGPNSSTNEKTNVASRLTISINPIINVLVQLKHKAEKPTIICNNMVPSSPETNNPINHNERPFGISAYGGTLIGLGSYSGAEVRSETSQWLPGYYVGIRVPILQTEKFDIYSSFEHKYAVQLFEINKTDSTKVSLQNTLVGVSTNALTGKETQVHEDTVGFRKTTHDYTHYNTFRINTLNIGLSRSIEFGSFQLDASVGAAYSFLVLSKGKTIGNEHNIIDYNSQLPIYSSSNFGFEAGLDIYYSINKKIRINTNIRGEYSTSNWNKENNVRFKPSFIKLGGGINYIF